MAIQAHLRIHHSARTENPRAQPFKNETQFQNGPHESNVSVRYTPRGDLVFLVNMNICKRMRCRELENA